MDGQLDTTPSILAKELEAIAGCLKQSWLKLNPSNMEALQIGQIGISPAVPDQATGS